MRSGSAGLCKLGDFRHDNIDNHHTSLFFFVFDSHQLTTYLPPQLLFTTMSTAYQALVLRLRDNMQSLPGALAENSNYETWAHVFAKNLVSHDRSR